MGRAQGEVGPRDRWPLGVPPRTIGAVEPRPPTAVLAAEDGQTAIEYLGMLLVSAAVIAVFLKAAPGIGDQIVSAIKDQIDAILGG